MNPMGQEVKPMGQEEERKTETEKRRKSGGADIGFGGEQPIGVDDIGISFSGMNSDEDWVKLEASQTAKETSKVFDHLNIQEHPELQKKPDDFDVIPEKTH
jgi:hypothetical protein